METSNVAILVEDHATKAKSFLEEASKTKNQETYDKAIEEYVSAVKHALLLNSDKGTQRLCMFNLGATYIAAGKYQRGIDVLERLLKEAQTNDEVASAVPYGDILFNTAYGYEQIQKYNKALAYYEDALLQYREHGDSKPMLCETLINIAHVYTNTKNYEQAISFYSQSAEAYADDFKYLQSCFALIHQSRLMLSLRSISDEECLRVLQSCLTQCVKIKVVQSKCDILNELGLIYTLVNSMQNSIFCFQTILSELEQLSLAGEKTNGRTASTLQNLASVYNTVQDYENAINCTHEAVDIFGKLSRRKAQGQCFYTMAYAQSQMENYDGARESFMYALQAFKDSSDNAGQWQAHEGLAALHVIKESFETSIHHYQLAIRLQADTPNPRSEDQNRLVKKLSQAIFLQIGEKGSNEVPEKQHVRPKTATRPHSARAKTPEVVPISSKSTPRRVVKRRVTTVPVTDKTEVDAGRRTYNEGENQPIMRNHKRPSSRGLSRQSTTTLSRTVSDMQKIELEESKVTKTRKWYHNIPFMDDEEEIEMSRRSVEEALPGTNDVIYSNIQSPGVHLEDETESDNLKTISEGSDADTPKQVVEVVAEVHEATTLTATPRANDIKSDDEQSTSSGSTSSSSSSESDLTVVSEKEEEEGEALQSEEHIYDEITVDAVAEVKYESKPLVVDGPVYEAVKSSAAPEDFVDVQEAEVKEVGDEIYEMATLVEEEEVTEEDAEKLIVHPEPVTKISMSAAHDPDATDVEEEIEEVVEVHVEESVKKDDLSSDSSSSSSSSEDDEEASPRSVVEVTSVHSDKPSEEEPKIVVDIPAPTQSEEEPVAAVKTTPVKPPRSILTRSADTTTASSDTVYAEVTKSPVAVRFNTTTESDKQDGSIKSSHSSSSSSSSSSTSSVKEEAQKRDNEEEEITSNDVTDLTNAVDDAPPLLDLSPVEEEMIQPVVIHHYGEEDTTSRSSNEQPSSSSKKSSKKNESYLIMPPKQQKKSKKNKPSKACTIM